MPWSTEIPPVTIRTFFEGFSYLYGDSRPVLIMRRGLCSDVLVFRTHSKNPDYLYGTCVLYHGEPEVCDHAAKWYSPLKGHDWMTLDEFHKSKSPFAIIAPHAHSECGELSPDKIIGTVLFDE